MKTLEWKVSAGTDSVSALYEQPDNWTKSVVFVCAHGAGGNMHDRGMMMTAGAMRGAGLGVARFNFVYSENKSGRPDPMPKCMDVVAAVVERVRAELQPKYLIIGGRSMGGRAASMLAADGFNADGLLLLAYPLHPAGQPEKLRDAHLPRIMMPVLCFNGTRDTLCTPELMDRVLTKVTTKWDMRWVETADHSFHVLKSSGKTDAQAMAEIGTISGEWVRTHITG